MRSPAAAIGWEFRQRHRWGLIGLGVYLVVLAAIKLAVLRGGLSIRVDSPESFAFIVVVPLTATFVYFLSVFSFGLAGDLAARPSIYPARLFTLPVSTARLALWPMLYGSAAMVALWLATRLLAQWPSGIAVPTIWPALMAAVLLAWTQALTWLPYGLPVLRVVVTMLWLGAVDTTVLLALEFHASESFMAAILAPQLPLAYLAARYAVARARRGEVPDWRGARARPARIAAVPERPRDGLRTAARAQAWLEWRQHGRSLPAWVGMLLPFELALLFAAYDAPFMVLEIVLIALVTPPLMAAFNAGAARKPGPAAGDPYGVSPFIATRPMSTAELVAAKLRMTIRSTLVAWLLVLVAIPLGLTLSDTWPELNQLTRRLSDAIGTTRAAVVTLLLVAGLMASTWKQQVQNLCLGLTGRAWLIKGTAFAILVLLFLLGPIVQWLVDHRTARVALWNSLPLILAVLAVCKLLAAGWIATRVFRSRVLSDRALLTGAACWCGAVLALYALFAWMLSSGFFPRYVLALVAILAVPLVRVSAMPLALAWNRHR